MLVVVRLDGMKDTDHRANIKMEVTGLNLNDNLEVNSQTSPQIGSLV